MFITRLSQLLSGSGLILLLLTSCQSIRPSASTQSLTTSPTQSEVPSTTLTSSSTSPIISTLSQTTAVAPTTTSVLSPTTSVVSPTTSAAPPSVVSVNLPVDQAGNWIGSDISINFSVSMDEDTTARALALSPILNYEVLWKNHDTTMIIEPLANWAIHTAYTVKIMAQAKSSNGLIMRQDYSASFTVSARPESPKVMKTGPADGTVDVLPESVFQITFSKPMNTQATEDSLRIIPDTDLPRGFTILWDNNNQRLTFEFWANMMPGDEYTITVTQAAMSADGVCMDADYTFSFWVMSC